MFTSFPRLLSSGFLGVTARPSPDVCPQCGLLENLHQSAAHPLIDLRRFLGSGISPTVDSAIQPPRSMGSRHQVPAVPSCTRTSKPYLPVLLQAAHDILGDFGHRNPPSGDCGPLAIHLSWHFRGMPEHTLGPGRRMQQGR